MAKNDDGIVQLLTERLAPGEALIEYLPAHKEPFPRIVLSLLFLGTGILPGVIIYYSMLKYYVIGLTETGLVMLRTNSKRTQVLAEKRVEFADATVTTKRIGMRRVVKIKPGKEPAIELELSPDHKKVTDGVNRRDRLFDALTQQGKSAGGQAKAKAA